MQVEPAVRVPPEDGHTTPVPLTRAKFVGFAPVRVMLEMVMGEFPLLVRVTP